MILGVSRLERPRLRADGWKKAVFPFYVGLECAFQHDPKKAQDFFNRSSILLLKCKILEYLSLRAIFLWPNFFLLELPSSLEVSLSSVRPTTFLVIPFQLMGQATWGSTFSILFSWLLQNVQNSELYHVEFHMGFSNILDGFLGVAINICFNGFNYFCKLCRSLKEMGQFKNS